MTTKEKALYFKNKFGDNAALAVGEIINSCNSICDDSIRFERTDYDYYRNMENYWGDVLVEIAAIDNQKELATAKLQFKIQKMIAEIKSLGFGFVRKCVNGEPMLVAGKQFYAKKGFLLLVYDIEDYLTLQYTIEDMPEWSKDFVCKNQPTGGDLISMYTEILKRHER